MLVTFDEPDYSALSLEFPVVLLGAMVSRDKAKSRGLKLVWIGDGNRFEPEKRRQLAAYFFEKSRRGALYCVEHSRRAIDGSYLIDQDRPFGDQIRRKPHVKGPRSRSGSDRANYGSS